MNLRVYSTLALAVGFGAALAAQSDYVKAIEAFRQAQEERLRNEAGWLTVAGLHFLNEGESRFGSGPLNDFILPNAGADEVGVFEFHDGRTTVRGINGGTITVNGEAVPSAELKRGSDLGDNADQITTGTLVLFLHKSGDRWAIRVLDKESALLRGFTGRKWFPVDEAYRVTARFVPDAEPRTLPFPNVLGDVETYESPGIVTFELDGQPYSLRAVSTGRGLWFIFRDLTSGEETYPATRFLNAPAPVDGVTELDFNKATNPPCAFNPNTTCPLPPQENRLRVRIEAGELDYHKSQHVTN